MNSITNFFCCCSGRQAKLENKQTETTRLINSQTITYSTSSSAGNVFLKQKVIINLTGTLSENDLTKLDDLEKLLEIAYRAPALHMVLLKDVLNPKDYSV